MELFVNAYYLMIVIASLLDCQRNHGPALKHLQVLSSIKVATMGTITFLPARKTISDGQDVLSAWNIDLVCSIAAWTVIVFIPQGPRLHYPPEKVYSSQTLLASETFPEENVSEEIGMCPIYSSVITYSVYMFTY